MSMLGVYGMREDPWSQHLWKGRQRAGVIENQAVVWFRGGLSLAQSWGIHFHTQRESWTEHASTPHNQPNNYIQVVTKIKERAQHHHYQ